MEDFIVSARKYRPQTFDSVVGQKSITQTLLKAMENNHLAQAFLFCGPRGVGKTTCARILAKTVNDMNVENADDDHDYSFNIFELDAASNNSVDDIRSLIDQVRIPPQVGKYKVYIIDEVHMLSASAFNAFLKTLEEPPPYAIFILATTEKHKVLPTILSRCQIFDFNRIQIPDIVSQLQSIANQEGIEIEGDALHIIAEKADGAMRDALSIFDQIVGFSGTKVSYEDVITNLNVLDYDYYFKLTDAFLNADHSEAIVIYANILDKGFDGHSFVNGLANHFRNLLFCSSEKTAAILEVGEKIRKQYVQQASLCSQSLLMNGMNILSEVDVNYKASKNQRLLVEIALLRLCSLVEKLNQKKNDNISVGANQESPSVASKNPVPKVLEPKPKLNPSPKLSAEEPRANSVASGEITQEKSQLEHKVPAEKEIIPPKVELKPDEKKKSFSSKLGGFKTVGVPTLSQLGSKPNSTTSEIDASEEPESIDFSDKPAEPFNQAELWEVWDKYAEKIKKEDKKSYYATLTKHKVILRDDYQLELLVDNHVQLADLNLDKSNLVGFLRESLQNWKIILKGTIDEEDRDDGDSLYDPQKKFEAMAERNPAIVEMRKRFDLDVDYDA